MNYQEILGAAKYFGAIAILNEKRKSKHSFTGYCVDVFFFEPERAKSFNDLISKKLKIFIAEDFHQDYVRVRVPCK